MVSLDFLFALLANQLPFAEQSLRAKAALANNTGDSDSSESDSNSGISGKEHESNLHVWCW